MKDLDIAGNQGNDTIRVSGTLGFLSGEIMAGGGDDLVNVSGTQMTGARSSVVVVTTPFSSALAPTQLVISPSSVVLAPT